MALPTQSVTLSPDQIGVLNQKVATLRHDINNQVGLIIAAIEIMQVKPELFEKMTESMMQQPPKIADTLQQFSVDFEKTFGITRP
jgi:hypothetical protein